MTVVNTEDAVADSCGDMVGVPFNVAIYKLLNGTSTVYETVKNAYIKVPTTKYPNSALEVEETVVLAARHPANYTVQTSTISQLSGISFNLSFKANPSCVADLVSNIGLWASLRITVEKGELLLNNTNNLVFGEDAAKVFLSTINILIQQSN